MEHLSSLSLFLRCEGKLLCSMIVGDDKFGKPCPTLKKYLEVTFACIKGDEYWVSINKFRCIVTYHRNIKLRVIPIINMPIKTDKIYLTLQQNLQRG